MLGRGVGRGGERGGGMGEESRGRCWARKDMESKVSAEEEGRAGWVSGGLARRWGTKVVSSRTTD